MIDFKKLLEKSKKMSVSDVGLQQLKLNTEAILQFLIDNEGGSCGKEESSTDMEQVDKEIESSRDTTDK